MWSCLAARLSLFAPGTTQQHLNSAFVEEGEEQMALPQIIRAIVESKLGAYCEKKIQPHELDTVRLGFRFRGNSVILFEEHTAFNNPDTRVDIVVAQFRFDPRKSVWTLYCATGIPNGIGISISCQARISRIFLWKLTKILRGFSGDRFQPYIRDRVYENKIDKSVKTFQVRHAIGSNR